MALVQMEFGSVLITGVREPGGSWDLEYALWSSPFALVGLLILVFAYRNCSRLWRLPAREAPWGLVVAIAVAASFSMMVATGPLTVGEWKWASLIEALFGTFLVVVLVREVRRKLARATNVGQVKHAEPH